MLFLHVQVITLVEDHPSLVTDTITLVCLAVLLGLTTLSVLLLHVQVITLVEDHPSLVTDKITLVCLAVLPGLTLCPCCSFVSKLLL